MIAKTESASLSSAEGLSETSASFRREHGSIRLILPLEPVRIAAHGMADEQKLTAVPLAPCADQQMRPQAEPLPDRKRAIHAR